MKVLFLAILMAIATIGLRHLRDVPNHPTLHTETMLYKKRKRKP